MHEQLAQALGADRAVHPQLGRNQQRGAEGAVGVVVEQLLLADDAVRVLAHGVQQPGRQAVERAQPAVSIGQVLQTVLGRQPG